MSTQPSGEVSDAIARQADELDRALVAGDPEQVAGFFTEDAILGESGMPDAVGRDAIRGFLAAANQIRSVVHHRLFRDELHPIGADLCVEVSHFDEAKIRHGETARIEERGRVVTFWARQSDGAWRIRRILVSDLP